MKGTDRVSITFLLTSHDSLRSTVSPHTHSPSLLSSCHSLRSFHSGPPCHHDPISSVNFLETPRGATIKSEMRLGKEIGSSLDLTFSSPSGTTSFPSLYLHSLILFSFLSVFSL